jgi:hypothetical protein
MNDEEIFEVLESFKKDVDETFRQSCLEKYGPEMYNRFMRFKIDEVLLSLEYDIETFGERIGPINNNLYTGD